MTTPLRNCALFMIQETREQYADAFSAAFGPRAIVVLTAENLTELKGITASTLASHLEALLSFLTIEREQSLHPVLYQALFENASTEVLPRLIGQIAITEAVRVRFFQSLQRDLQRTLEETLETYVADSLELPHRMA